MFCVVLALHSFRGKVFSKICSHSEANKTVPGTDHDYDASGNSNAGNTRRLYLQPGEVLDLKSIATQLRPSPSPSPELCNQIGSEQLDTQHGIPNDDTVTPRIDPVMQASLHLKEIKLLCGTHSSIDCLWNEVAVGHCMDEIDFHCEFAYFENDRPVVVTLKGMACTAVNLSNNSNKVQRRELIVTFSNTLIVQSVKVHS